MTATVAFGAELYNGMPSDLDLPVADVVLGGHVDPVSWSELLRDLRAPSSGA